MKKNILVYQVRIGDGSLYSSDKNTDNPFIIFESKICLPSVQQWAARCGYDYKLYTESTISQKNFFESYGQLYSAEKMMHVFSADHDYVIYVDSDIFVSPRAGLFPLQKGLSAVPQPTLPEFFYSRLFVEKGNNEYINAGVFSIDKENGLKLFEYFQDRLNSNDKSKTRIEYGEQDMLNQWQVENGCNYLDDKWNCMLYQYVIEQTNLKNKNFYHFIYDTKEQYIPLFRKIKNLSK